MAPGAPGAPGGGDRDERGYHVSEVQRAGHGGRGGRGGRGRGAAGRGGGARGAGPARGGGGRGGNGGGSHSRGIPAWAVTAGLTGGAMIAVSFLALQASGAPVAKSSSAPPSPRASVTAHPHTPPPPPPVPANSGTGKRIVYSLSQHRVWIVPASGKPVTTFTVQPGTVPARPGPHLVTRRKSAGTGTDGASIEHIVFFDFTAETWVAFSSATDDKVSPPSPSLHTGAIRSHRADGDAIWNATHLGSKVYVVR